MFRFPRVSDVVDSDSSSAPSVLCGNSKESEKYSGALHLIVCVWPS